MLLFVYMWKQFDSLLHIIKDDDDLCEQNICVILDSNISISFAVHLKFSYLVIRLKLLLSVPFCARSLSNMTNPARRSNSEWKNHKYWIFMRVWSGLWDLHRPSTIYSSCFKRWDFTLRYTSLPFSVMPRILNLSLWLTYWTMAKKKDSLKKSLQL